MKTHLIKFNEMKCKVLQLGCNSPHSGMGEDLTGWKRGSQGIGEKRAGQGQWCALMYLQLAYIFRELGIKKEKFHAGS